MKKTLLLITFFFSIFMTTLSAQEGKGRDVFEQEGFTYIQEEAGSTNGDKILLLKNKNGASLEVRYRSIPVNETVRQIDKMMNIFTKFQSIQSEKFVFFLPGDKTIEAVLAPVEIEHNGKSYTENVPSGITFQWDGTLTYGFRIHADEMFVKIRGFYESETEILEKIAAAIEDPAKYMKTRDSEYIVAQLEKLEKENSELRRDLYQTQRAVIFFNNKGLFSGPKEVESDKITKIVTYARANPTKSASQISEEMKAAGTDVSKKEVELVIAVFLGRFED